MFELNGIKEGEYIEYKGRPVVRHGNEIYYGDLSDEYYAFLMIMSDKPSPKTGEPVPDKIMVQRIKSDTQMPDKNLTVNGLFAAFEMATAWLDRITNK